MGTNWTNAGRTVADAGILTTVDINGGSVDGVTLGTNSAVTNAVMTIMTASHARITNLDAVTINSISQTESTLEVSDKLIVSSLSASSAATDGGGLRIGGGQELQGYASMLYDHGNTALDFNIKVADNEVTQVRLADGVFRPETDSDVDLGASGAAFKALYVDSIDLNGQGSISFGGTGRLDLDGDDDTSIRASADDVITFECAGADQLSLADGSLTPAADDDLDLGSSSRQFKDLYIDGVAYIDDLRADALGAALNCASQALTNVNIDSGDISAATISGGLTWSAAQDLNNVNLTNIDVDSGAIDGTTIGAASAAAGTFTTLIGSTVSGSSTVSGASFSADGAGAFGGAVTANSLSGSGAVSGHSLDIITSAAIDGTATVGGLTCTAGATFGGGYGSSGVTISSAGTIQANGSLVVGTNTQLDGVLTVGGGYSDGGSGLSVSAAGVLQMNGNLTAGSDGEGADFKVFGAAANEYMLFDASENTLQFNNSSGAVICKLGGDATSEYAIDVTTGANNQNKIRAAAFVTYSDETLKTDIAQMNGALDKVMALKGVNFTWKDSNTEDFGLIAQEVAKVIPQAVHTSNGVSGVDYSRLSSVLIEAIKAQQAQIEELKNVISEK